METKVEIAEIESRPMMNAAAYCFAKLDNLKPLREQLTVFCRELGLKGTILLSQEGINLFVAGEQVHVEKLLTLLRAVPGLERLEAKFSPSREQPFNRMLVKIKREIIAFGLDDIDPASRPAPRISPIELKAWLDEGRPVTLLDTRNEYEVVLGTFTGAQSLGLRHFRDFPEALKQFAEQTDDRPVVTFCTGGIRCEKAAPYMLRQGFRNVLQLDGGILKYFEECGKEHFSGECFVFDQRVGLSSDLYESGHGVCFVCQSLLTPEELNDPLTVEGVSCPKCYRSPESRSQEALVRRNIRLRQAMSPLPGKHPQDNFRPLKASPRHDGLTLLEMVREIFPQIGEPEWRAHFAAGNLTDQAKQPVAAEKRVRTGDVYCSREPAQCEPDVSADVNIIHEDDAIIVVNKPAPLPVHPCGRFHRNTLSHVLKLVYAPQKPRPAHRIDACTTGLVVFTRTATYARLLQPQFERQEVEKCYLARVHGSPMEDCFECREYLVWDDARRVMSILDDENRTCHTRFRVLHRLQDGQTLLEAKPQTGRTNQIRAHLWNLGLPIVGDATYLPDRQLNRVKVADVDAPPMMLHAWQLSFRHPQTNERVSFEAPPPEWTKSPTPAQIA